MKQTLFHLSPRADIKVLEPSMPAEDILDGKLVWADDQKLPRSSACVCFTTNPEKSLRFNPIIQGFIYTPISKPHSVRQIYKEIGQITEWVDFCESQEVRVYEPVEVMCVGEFEMMPTEDGLRPKIERWK